MVRVAVVGAVCAVLGASAQAVNATPITAEARSEARSGDLHGATREAAARALLEAVRTVVRRHVPAVDYVRHAAEIRKSVLDRAPRYIQRYSITDERWEELVAVVRVEAEVDREGIVNRLESAGVPTAVLPVKPRLLLVPLDSTSDAPARAVATELEAVGYQQRVAAVFLSGELPYESQPSSVDEATLGEWARDAGCHLAVALATEREDSVGQSPGVDGIYSHSYSVPLTDSLWFDPGGAAAPHRSRLALVAWVLDPAGQFPLGRLEAVGDGMGTELSAADQDAAAHAGLILGYQILQLLEQSGWSPKGMATELRLAVSGMVDPLLVEEIADSLAKLPEVQQIRLSEVSLQRAEWSLNVIDSGLDWREVLGSVRLPRGRLEWLAAHVAGTHLPGDGGMILNADVRWQRP